MDAPVYDVAIIGAGIVGASVAYFSAPQARVLLLEAESAPGYHTTGRSAALYAPAYGPRQVRVLTRASLDFFTAPPAGFASVPLLRPRPSMFVGTEADRAALRTLHAQLQNEGVEVELIDTAQALQRVPVLRPQACALAVVEQGSSDIDVDALLQGFLRGASAAGAQRVTHARVRALHHSDGVWTLRTEDGRIFAARRIVNAAGAWADEVAVMAGAQTIGLQPCRRTAFLFEPPAGAATADWPAVVAADESWYFKPDAGLLLGSPANADPVHPHDVVAEELDVALGIHRIEAATTLQIRRPRSTWAGLRCFVADGEPVCGPDPVVPGFFWAAAVGGYGIQSSPGFGRLCSSLLLQHQAPPGAAWQSIELAALEAGRAGLRSARA